MTRFPIAPFVVVAVLGSGIVACSSNNDGTGTNTTLEDTGGFSPDSSIVTDGNYEPEIFLDGNMPDVKASELGGDAGCGGSEVKATARDANLLLVIDKSGSMLQKPSGFATNKWTALKTSLKDALTAAKSRMAMGLVLYPYDAATPIADPCAGNCCAVPTGAAAVNVPVEPGTTAVDKILSAIDGTAPGGATPTAEALKRALEYYTTGAGKDLKGDKFVLLATDGGPNCNSAITCAADKCTTNIDGSCSGGGNCCDPATGGSKISCVDDGEVRTQLAALKTAGIRTFVVGIPGTEAYATYLDQFAEAGGFVSPTGPKKYFEVSAAGGTDALTKTFALITGELITSCRLQLATDPPDTGKLNLYVDGKLIPQSGADGWEIDATTSPPTIVLKGKTCDDVKGKGAKVISVSYGCPTIK